MNIQEMYDAYEWLRMLDWNEQVGLLTEQARAELAKRIATSRKEVEAYIENTPLKGWQKRSADGLLEDIDEKIGEACGTMTELITAAAIGTAEESIKAYGDILSAGGAAKNVRLMDGLSREQIKAVFTDQPLGGRLLSDWVERAFHSKVRQELRISLNDGLEHGHSTRRIVEAMKAKLPEGYVKAEREMTTLARTYIQAANVGAQELCYKANEDVIKGYRRVGALDNRTCLTCAILDGKKYYGAQKRPKLPQHPRCRCIYLPITKSFEELGLDIPEFEEEARHWAIREDGSIGTGGKKVIKHGTIKGTYRDWYESLSEEDKAKTAIGPKRREFLKRGGRWKDLIDGDNDTFVRIDAAGGFNRYAAVTGNAGHVPVSVRSWNSLAFDHASVQIRDVVDHFDKPVDVVLQTTKKATDAWYTPSTNKISLGGNYFNSGAMKVDIDTETTYRHEYGHHVDRMLGNNVTFYSEGKFFSTALVQDEKLLIARAGKADISPARLQALSDEAVEKGFKKLGIDLSEFVTEISPHVSNQGTFDDLKKALIGLQEQDAKVFYEAIVGGSSRERKATHNLSGNYFGDLSDLIGSITKNKVCGMSSGYGHKDAYYTRQFAAQHEAFANLFEIMGRNSASWNAILKALVPNLSAEFERKMSNV